MNRKSWTSSQKKGAIRLGEKTPSEAADVPQSKVHAVPKAALEEGILRLLASAAELQQRQDLESARQLYEAAMEKVKAHGLNRKRLLTGTSKKPPPLNSRTPLQWCLHVGDIPSAVCLIGSPNAALAELRTSLPSGSLEQVLDAGADIEFRIGPMGRTLLLQETAEGRRAGVRLALDRGASLSVMDDNGDHALALALMCQVPQAKRIVEDLIEAGADMDTKDGKGQKLLWLALDQSQPEVLGRIIELIRPLTSDHHECISSWAEKLLVRGSAWSDRICDVLRLLLMYGLDPNLQLQPNAASTLFEWVVRQKAPSEDLIRDLLDQGATPNLAVALQNASLQNIELTIMSLTPLQEVQHQQIAAWLKNLPLQPQRWTQRDCDIIMLLLDYGMDPNVRRSESPHSPLIVCAADAGNVPLVEKLIRLKAKTNVVDDNSDTALICAAKRSNRQIYDALKQAGVNDQLFFGLSTIWASHQHGH